MCAGLDVDWLVTQGEKKPRARRTFFFNVLLLLCLCIPPWPFSLSGWHSFVKGVSLFF